MRRSAQLWVDSIISELMRGGVSAEAVRVLAQMGRSFR
jgi:hypothetical protein